MALCKSSSPSHHLQSSFTIFQFSIFFILLLSHANAITFNFSDFQQNENRILYEGDAFSSNKVIQLTKNQRDDNLTSSVGRASFSQAVRLWDAKTRRLTDFSTHFSFIIKALDEKFSGDGLVFFLVPYKSQRPPTSESAGGYLGLSSFQSAFNYTVNSTENAVVAVEFDSYKNEWDPSSNHVGINVNSIISKKNVTWKSSIKNGSRANAWVSYNSTTQNLSVFLSYAENPVFSGNSSLFHIVDLRDVLPEWVRVGFSASTGLSVEIHNILSWDFSSSLEISDEGRNNKSISDEGRNKKSISDEGRNKKSKTGLVVGLVVGFSVLFGLGVGLTLFFRRKKKVPERRKDDMNSDIYMDDEFEKGTGAKRFSYDELARATGNFNEDGKLGEGGFGGVYKGYIGQLNLNIAVKRVSSGSKQGKKEYVSEVRIISRLRHRNLVQLIGWSHERGEFLLVYEFMPNGSLDYHLFRRESMLSWAVRYKIALGLASALLYLHEEWEQCVVHRDIKSSNVMLDSSFNAKLGDFGLARLVDHESGSQTTVVAGTRGYLAPECVTTGKSSKESDVYSFGIVALEIACGRRPAEQNKVNLVEWVWELYGKSNLIEAIDKRLSMDFVEAQTECLMVVGLWCAHPDHNVRPSIRQVINVLNFGSPLPILPSKLPTPVYFAPPMGFNTLLFSSSNGHTDSTDTSSKFTMSSKSSSPSASLLHSQANI